MKKILFILSFLASFTFNVWAQTPCFTVENTVGCTPFTVKVKNCCKTYTSIFYDYESKGKYIRDTVYTFTKAGVYTIKQQVGKDSTHKNDPDPSNFYYLTKRNIITVVDAKPPKFKLVPCANNKLRVIINDVTTQKYSHYYINYGDGTIDSILNSGYKEHTYTDSLPKTLNISGKIMPVNCGADTTFIYNGLFVSLKQPKVNYIKIQNSSKTNGSIVINFETYNFLTYQLSLNGKPHDTLYNQSDVTNYILNNLNTTDSINTIQVSVLDLCTNSSLNSEIYYVRPLNVTIQENQNTITDITYPNSTSLLNYEILKNNISYTNINESTLSNFIDTKVRCGAQYCYIIKTKLLSGVYILSDTVCVTSISTTPPPAPVGINSSISNDKVELYCQKPTTHSVLKYDIYKETNNIVSNSAIETLNFPYLDINTNPTSSTYCYQITVTDSCNNVSERSLTTCPISLKGTNITSSSIDLHRENYSGWENGLGKYSLQWINELGEVYKNIPINNSKNYKDLAEDTISSLIRYRIMGESVNSDFITYSNIIERKQAVKIFLPTAFSPNGDGINDLYIPKGRFISNFKMYIYNQLGQLVFYSNDFNKGWNGDENPSGDYVVEIEASDTIGNTIKKKSIITLIK